MKIYVASSWRDESQPVVVVALRAMGHEVYDFRQPAADNHGFHWSEVDPGWKAWDADEFVAALEHPVADQGFALDMDAMRWCDACVLVVPKTPGRSSHLELGWCAGAGKATAVLLLDDGEPELMYKMADVVATSLRGLRAWLSDVAPEPDPHAPGAPCKTAILNGSAPYFLKFCIIRIKTSYQYAIFMPAIKPQGILCL